MHAERNNRSHENKCISTATPPNEAWTSNIFFEYKIPLIYDEDGKPIPGAKTLWLDVANYIIEDLAGLLRLESRKFWSSLEHNPSIINCLVSCLQEFPTMYNLDKFPRESDMRQALESMRRNVLLVLARLVVHKNTKDEFMTQDKHGKLLYDEFLITVPMMLDICQLYGRESPEIAKTIITNAVKLQPAYREDFQKMAGHLIEVFQNIDARFEDHTVPLINGAIPLSERSSGSVLTLELLTDYIVQLYDLSSNISVFLDCYPPASDLFYTENFVRRIVHTYGNTIPEMYRRVQPLMHNDDTVERFLELKHLLDVTRIELLKVFRTVTYHHIARLLKDRHPSQVPGAERYVEQFVNFLNKAVDEKEFMLDYHISYPINVDLDNVLTINPDVDHAKCNYITRSVAIAMAEPEGSKHSNPPTNNNATSRTIPSAMQQPATVSIPAEQRSNGNDNDTNSKDPVHLQSLISGVKDILCNLGEGFILECLKHYNNDVTAVINAVCEESLPEHLKSLDRALPHIPPDPEEAAAANDRLLGAQRLNVFDNDEFDVMTRDSIDQSRVHRGKRKDGYRNFGHLLDDKSHRKQMGHVYEKYSIVDEYEDEYDDTYDSHEIGPRGIDEPLEIAGKLVTTPRVLRANGKHGGDDDENEEDDTDEPERDEGPSGSQNDRFNFVQNPEVLRAQAEQRRFSKRGGRGGGGNKSAPDLVGRPKGQGNDQSVLAGRDRKNTNKASRANHNRRQGADYKRKQGML